MVILPLSWCLRLFTIDLSSMQPAYSFLRKNNKHTLVMKLCRVLVKKFSFFPISHLSPQIAVGRGFGSQKTSDGYRGRRAKRIHLGSQTRTSVELSSEIIC